MPVSGFPIVVQKTLFAVAIITGLSFFFFTNTTFAFPKLQCKGYPGTPDPIPYREGFSGRKPVASGRLVAAQEVLQQNAYWLPARKARYRIYDAGNNELIELDSQKPSDDEGFYREPFTEQSDALDASGTLTGNIFTFKRYKNNQWNSFGTLTSTEASARIVVLERLQSTDSQQEKLRKLTRVYREVELEAVNASFTGFTLNPFIKGPYTEPIKENGRTIGALVFWSVVKHQLISFSLPFPFGPSGVRSVLPSITIPQLETHIRWCVTGNNTRELTKLSRRLSGTNYKLCYTDTYNSMSIGTMYPTIIKGGIHQEDPTMPYFIISEQDFSSTRTEQTNYYAGNDQGAPAKAVHIQNGFISDYHDKKLLWVTANPFQPDSYLIKALGEFNQKNRFEHAYISFPNAYEIDNGVQIARTAWSTIYNGQQYSGLRLLHWYRGLRTGINPIPFQTVPLHLTVTYTMDRVGVFSRETVLPIQWDPQSNSSSDKNRIYYDRGTNRKGLNSPFRMTICNPVVSSQPM